jgi:hypothetical protein
MKQALSLLVGFVLIQTQAWALSGGPPEDLAQTNYQGTYAGVLIPESSEDLQGSTSIGLFSFSQGETGFTSGTALTFVNGTVFNGTIQGVIDPKNGSLRGVLDGGSTFTVSGSVPSGVDDNGNQTFTTEQFPILCQGSLKAKIKPDQSGITAARVEGTASLDVFFQIQNDGTPSITETTEFQVDGFQQSRFATLL